MRVMRGFVLTSLLLAGAAVPASAQSLLDGILGGTGDSPLITIGSGTASDSGVVNLGLGGDNGNLADLNIGGSSSSIASANVTLGSNSGTLVHANLLGDGGVAVIVKLRHPNIRNIIPTDPPITRPVPNPDVDPQITASIRGAARFGGGGAANCGTDTSAQINELLAGSAVDASWSRASGVQVQRVEVCPELRSRLAEYLQTSGRGSAIQPAVRADSLISASLSRSPYSADHVFAVRKQGDRLVVYVY